MAEPLNIEVAVTGFHTNETLIVDLDAFLDENNIDDRERLIIYRAINIIGRYNGDGFYIEHV